MYIPFEVHIHAGTYRFSLSVATTHAAITQQRGQVQRATQKLVEANASQHCEYKRVFFIAGLENGLEWWMEWMMEF